MSRDYYALTDDDRKLLKIVAANNEFLQNDKGYDDFYMADLWGVKVDTYDDYKLYGPGKSAIKFIKFANKANVSLDRFLCNRLEAPFYYSEPAVVRPYDYAIKLLDTAFSFGLQLTPAERENVALAYYKRFARWTLTNQPNEGRIL